MGGHCYGEEPPITPCPYCGTPTEADYVDVGIGYVQCGPFHCTACHASEIGPNDGSRPLTQRERETGWYAPHSEPGSSANVINGVVVSHRAALAAYKDKFTGNPEYNVPGAVEAWREDMRRPK